CLPWPSCAVRCPLSAGTDPASRRSPSHTRWVPAASHCHRRGRSARYGRRGVDVPILWAIALDHTRSGKTRATLTGIHGRRGPFTDGDTVQLTDPKGRMHTITLREGGAFHSHKGRIAHEDLIGEPEGSVVQSN